MAKYAENLIGNWEFDQYEPLREVAQIGYQTNWDKLTNDLNNLNEQLAQNFKNARISHNKALLDNSIASYANMYNAENNLANRGLTGSGLMNVYNAENTRQIGDSNTQLMENLMAANKANVEGSLSGLDTYATGVSKLADDLANDLAGITNAETDNLQNYRNLVSDISESAAVRASSKSGSGGEEDEELDKIYQLITIKDIMGDSTTDDSSKYYDLVRDAAITPEQAERILSSYNYNKVSDKISSQQNKLNKANKTLSNYTSISPNYPMVWWVDNLSVKPKQNRLNELNKELSQYTYEDLKNILGY